MTLKAGVMAAGKSALPSQEYIIIPFKIYENRKQFINCNSFSK